MIILSCSKFILNKVFVRFDELMFKLLQYKWQKILIRIFEDKKYEIFSITVIILNVIAMAITHYKQSAVMTVALNILSMN